MQIVEAEEKFSADDSDVTFVKGSRFELAGCQFQLSVVAEDDVSY
jgi:hypothetical protein